MTGSMTSLFDLTCAADQREKGVQSQLTCKLSPESHRTQVWLCFLFLSLLSASTCATPVSEAEDQLVCLRDLTPMIEKSDAMLYAPPIANITDKCINESLKCFMMELIMVIEEEAVPDIRSNCIYDFNKTLYHGMHSHVRCPQCEEYPLQSISKFLDRLNNILQKINAMQKNIP